MTTRIAEHSRPNHTVLHLSDTHLRATGLLYDRVDGLDRLRRIFANLADAGSPPDALVFTGDLADRGETLAYGMLRSVVDPVVRSLGSKPIWVMGEHDDRVAFRTTLLGQQPSREPVCRSTFVNGLRVITLDTSVPGEYHGDLGDEQLDWLASELSTAAPHGTIIAMHHPPMPSVSALDASTELRHQDALAEVLTGSDVRSIVAGHLHYSATGSFAGIPVSVASSTSFTQDLQVPHGESRLRDGAQCYNLVQLFEHSIVHTVVPVGESNTLDRVSAEETQRLLALSGVITRPLATEDDQLQPSTVWELTPV